MRYIRWCLSSYCQTTLKNRWHLLNSQPVYFINPSPHKLATGLIRSMKSEFFERKHCRPSVIFSIVCNQRCQGVFFRPEFSKFGDIFQKKNIVTSFFVHLVSKIVDLFIANLRQFGINLAGNPAPATHAQFTHPFIVCARERDPIKFRGALSPRLPGRPRAAGRPARSVGKFPSTNLVKREPPPPYRRAVRNLHTVILLARSDRQVNGHRYW